MATVKQAITILEKMKELKPLECFNRINANNEGTAFVMLYLYKTKTEIYASKLSSIMKISRARMSVLIEKLLTKGYIKVTPSLIDTRKDVISLTPLGIREIQTKKEKAETCMMKIIDEIGYENMCEYINTTQKIKEIIKTNCD